MLLTCWELADFVDYVLCRCSDSVLTSSSSTLSTSSNVQQTGFECQSLASPQGQFRDTDDELSMGSITL